MASTKTWALLTQSLFILMAGAERFIARELEGSLRKDGADDLLAIFKENNNEVCGSTEIHDALTKAQQGTIADMRTINWVQIINLASQVASPYLDQVGLAVNEVKGKFGAESSQLQALVSEKERCEAVESALVQFKEQMLELNQAIEVTFTQVSDLSKKVSEAELAMEDMFVKLDGMTKFELELSVKLAVLRQIRDKKQAEMASIKEQETILKASLSTVIAAFTEATSKLNDAMGGKFEPESPEANLKKLAETLAQKQTEMKKTLDDLMAKKRETFLALNQAIEGLGGTEQEFNQAKGEVETLDGHIQTAEADISNLYSLLSAAEATYQAALTAFTDMYKKGSNLAF